MGERDAKALSREGLQSPDVLRAVAGNVRYCAELFATMHFPTRQIDCLNAARDLEMCASRLEKLEQDARRLDWLFAELNDHVIVPKIHLVGNLYAMRANGCSDFRGAMDAAMRFTPDAAAV